MQLGSRNRGIPTILLTSTLLQLTAKPATERDPEIRSLLGWMEGDSEKELFGREFLEKVVVLSFDDGPHRIYMVDNHSYSRSQLSKETGAPLNLEIRETGQLLRAEGYTFAGLDENGALAKAGRP